jgi:hypothetical protein
MEDEKQEKQTEQPEQQKSDIQKLNEYALSNLAKDLEIRNLGLIMAVAFDPTSGKMKAIRYDKGVLSDISQDIDVLRMYNGNFKDNSMHAVTDFYMTNAKKNYDELRKTELAAEKEAKEVKDRNRPYKRKLSCLLKHDWIYQTSSLGTTRRCSRCNLVQKKTAYCNGSIKWSKIQIDQIEMA